MGDVEFTASLGVRTLGMQDDAFVLERDLERRHMSRAERAHGGVLFAPLDNRARSRRHRRTPARSRARRGRSS